MKFLIYNKMWRSVHTVEAPSYKAAVESLLGDAYMDLADMRLIEILDPNQEDDPMLNLLVGQYWEALATGETKPNQVAKQALIAHILSTYKEPT